MVMDKFEQQFEDLDVQSQYMENSMGNTTTLATPQADVERLMQSVADEHGLELNMQVSLNQSINFVIVYGFIVCCRWQMFHRRH
jgi:division protein CdvB (Snf7/Vps24/ESCRT-III family)